MSFLSELNWRYAVKNFNTQKKIDDKTFKTILNAIRMTPTSFGLQPFHVYIVQNKNDRIHIQEAAYGQPQILECSHLLVFCTRTDISEKRIDDLIETMSIKSGQTKEKLQGFSHVVQGFIGKMNTEEQKTWADRQTYIALGFALAACAELRVDSCPIEGFLPEKVDKILDIPKNQKTVVMLPLGYRKEDSPFPKIRFSNEDLFTQ